MSALRALRLAREVGVAVQADGDELVVEADFPPPPPVVEDLTEHKWAILSLLRGRDEWDAEDWVAYFQERARVARFEGDLDPHAAEGQAFECCVRRWLWRYPAVEAGGTACAGCGKRAGEVMLPVLDGSGEHVLVHPECHATWSRGRHQEAVREVRDLLEEGGLDPQVLRRLRVGGVP
ncbi:hypothetical protein [Prosthecomicrobium sp. N25]|uniref:hypothetical protein n=1 Tax=Prosthecomicrobium sp. N25 TaxID=3129254 RepID=UPI0030775B23